MGVRGASTYILATAYHEAGHALAALKVGRYVSRVSIRHESPGSGSTHFARATKSPFSLELNRGSARAAWEYEYKSARDEIFVCLAGPLAEAKATATPLRQMGNSHDLDYCMHVAQKLSDFASQVSKYVSIPMVCDEALFADSVKRVRSWVHRPKNWEVITAIAQRLEKSHAIQAEVLFDVIGEAQQRYRAKQRRVQ